MKLSTEAILTQVYGVPATPVQRAACRVRDGLPLDDLREHPDVITAFGGDEAVAALPSERGIKPAEFWNIASARTGKTTIAAAGALADSQSIDLSGLALGDVPRITVLSLKLDVADVPYTKIRAGMDHPAFKPLLISERPSDRMLTIRHPSGRAIEVCVAAGGQAGGGLANRWSAGIIPDEAPKMNARADDRSTNLDDVLSVARERMLDGAQISPIGSPWSPHGTAYDVVQNYFGKPTEDVVVMRTTGPAGNPVYWTPKRLARLEETDPVAWRINALGEFLDPESGLLSPIAVRQATRESPLELPPEDGMEYSAAIDPSEGKAGGNGFALCIIGTQHDDDPVRFIVAFAREWRGLDLGAILREIAGICARYGISSVRTDAHSKGALAGFARATAGLTLEYESSKSLEDWEWVRTQIHTGAVELPPDRQLRADLLGVKKRITQTGATIVLPTTSDGRHADLAAAFCGAMIEAQQRTGRFDLGKWMEAEGYSTSPDPGPIVPAYRDPVLDARAKEKLRHHNQLTRKV